MDMTIELPAELANLPALLAKLTPAQRAEFDAAFERGLKKLLPLVIQGLKQVAAFPAVAK
jgi:hypothetical protein